MRSLLLSWNAMVFARWTVGEMGDRLPWDSILESLVSSGGCAALCFSALLYVGGVDVG
jgi:hypothetical protein